MYEICSPFGSQEAGWQVPKCARPLRALLRAAPRFFVPTWLAGRLRGDFAEGARELGRRDGEGKRRLTESAREFPKVSTPFLRPSRS